MATPPSVIVREKRNGTPSIRGVSTSVAAFVSPAERGAVGRAVPVTSESQFRRIFGGPYASSYLYESVVGFFKNGGSKVYISRVGTDADTTATFDLLTAASDATYGTLTGTFPAALADQDTFLGKVDGGGAVTITIEAKPMTKTGAAATYAAPTGGDTLVFSIKLVNELTVTSTITFAGTENSQALYLAAINAQLTGGFASDSGGQIKITTDYKGSGAVASIVSMSAGIAARTGLAVGAFTNAGPNTVANVQAVTAAEFAALATAAYTGSVTTATSATTISWVTNTVGAAGSVQFSSGTGVSKVTGFDNAVHSGAAVGPGTATITVDASSQGLWGNNLKVKAALQDTKLGALSSVLTSGDTFAVMTASTAAKVTVGDMLKITDGTTTTRVVVKSVNGTKVTFTAAVTLGAPIAYATSVVTNETFSLTVYEGGVAIFGPVKDLRMSSLSSKNYFVTRVNKDGTDAEVPITVTDAGLTPSAATDPRPVNTSSATDGDSLTGGGESTTYTDANFTSGSNGFNVFDKIKEARLISCLGFTGISVAGAISKALVEYCALRSDCVALIEPPDALSPSACLTYFQTNLLGSSFGDAYYPWVLIQDPLSGQPVAVPPTGFVAGAIARTHRSRGVSKAPAGETDGQLFGTVGLSGVLPGEDLEDGDVGDLYDANINCIRNVVGRGQCVMGARTYEAGEFGWVHTRLAFIYFEQSIKAGTSFVLFEPTTAETRAKVKRVISAFCRKEWKAGNLDGETFEDSCFINCDDDNNPPTLQNAGITFAEVGLNVPGTTEYLIVEIGKDTRAELAELGG